jgi:ABC-type branched-subunit amino acid transport system permease subunit
MGLIHFLLHALNFLAPAFFVALLLPAANRYVLRNPNPRMQWWAQAAVHFAVGVAALLAGLVIFGVDGKMLTYLALVLGCATSQWLLTRG